VRVGGNYIELTSRHKMSYFLKAFYIANFKFLMSNTFVSYAVIATHNEICVVFNIDGGNIILRQNAKLRVEFTVFGEFKV